MELFLSQHAEREEAAEKRACAEHHHMPKEWMRW